MPAIKSTRRRTSAKRVVTDNSRPKRPHPACLFTPHRTGRWCKRINRTLYYFGRIADDPDAHAALEKLNRDLPYLKDGRTPPPLDIGEGLTIADLANCFLTSKREKLTAGELSEGTFRGYFTTCGMLVQHFGANRRVDDLRPDDFEKLRSKLAKKMSIVSLRNEINKTRVIFKYAAEQRLIDRPVHYGQSFDRPSQKALRQRRHEAGPRMFSAEELRKILDLLDGNPVHVEGKKKPVTRKADPALRAITLLGINCGFGNNDVARLPHSALDLENGWCNYPRPKTAVERRCPLWPETVAALRKALAVRPKPKSPADAGLCFVTIQGNRWVREREHSSGEPDRYVKIDTVTARFARVLKRLDINSRRGFYMLRHTHATISGEAKDQISTNSVMGHCDSSVPAMYREAISDERLKAVVDHVRDWLFPPKRAARAKRG